MINVDETRHDLTTLFMHQSKVLDGINDMLKVHDLPDYAARAIMKDIGILHDPHALPFCGELAKDIEKRNADDGSWE